MIFFARFTRGRGAVSVHEPRVPSHPFDQALTLRPETKAKMKKCTGKCKTVQIDIRVRLIRNSDCGPVKIKSYMHQRMTIQQTIELPQAWSGIQSIGKGKPIAHM